MIDQCKTKTTYECIIKTHILIRFINHYKIFGIFDRVLLPPRLESTVVLGAELFMPVSDFREGHV